MAKKQYRVRPGRRHGAQNQYGPGDLVELEESEAKGFEDKLQEVAPKAKPAQPADQADQIDDQPAKKTPTRRRRSKK